MLIKELKLQSTNIYALFSFYKELLNMDVIQSYNVICITAGETKLIFEQTNTKENPFYHFAFNIPSNRFEEAFEWTKKRAVLLWLDDYNSYIADFVNWHAKSFYFKDPAGNILEMIARFDLNNKSDEPFSSKQIRNVSEMGIVFPADSFDEQVDALLKQFSLDYFEKQPPMPQFRAIGNDEGLFILVPENRAWFATDNESKIYRSEITFIVKDNLHQLVLP
jgi:catechol-2,3-dioxygenase